MAAEQITGGTVDNNSGRRSNDDARLGPMFRWLPWIMQFGAIIWGAAEIKSNQRELNSTVVSIKTELEFVKNTNIRLQIEVTRLQTQLEERSSRR